MSKIYLIIHRILCSSKILFLRGEGGGGKAWVVGSPTHSMLNKAVPHPKCLLGAFRWLAHSDGDWRIRMDIQAG